MPLTQRDRIFLDAIDRLKVYILIMAFGVFVYLLLRPPGEIQLTASLLSVTLCYTFWLTQRLLSLISLLDVELTSTISAVKRVLPKDHLR